MTNEERRIALAMARRKALEYGERAEDVGFSLDVYEISRAMKMACMWAQIANAMKVGQALEADGVIPDIVTHR